MDREELHKSIQAYEEQLEQVKRTLEITGDDEERKSLESLKSDLVELIELTLQTIEQDETHYDSNEQQCESEFSESSSDKNTSLFATRVKNLEEISLDVDQNQSISDEVYEQKLQNIKDELKNMIGEKCSAPHNHSWGSIVYHNAIICGLEESCDYELANIKNFRIRVLFTNPTHREMIPCPYFLEGECKFNADKCHFSHGELIAIGELKEYQTPDFTKLTRNCVVLAKLDDRMWHKGKVICSNFIEKSCRIRINGQKNEIDLKFEDLFPIFHENENSSSENDDGNSDDDSNDSSDSDSSEIRDKKIIERTLLNPVSNQPLGDWEKHTRGIGSKLMKKMGYVFGAGLGSNGEGIVAPIIAQILPPGRSLDYCMELREMSSDGDNLFSLEKKMKKEQQKAKRLNRNDDDSRKKQQQNGDDIFSFLNDNILSAGNLDMGGAGNKQNKISINSNDFRNHSTKKLNIENVKIGDEIRKKEKEINKIKESIKRHSIGTDIYERLKMQFNYKNHELENLKQSECKLNKEQISRKKLDESFVF